MTTHRHFTPYSTITVSLGIILIVTAFALMVTPSPASGELYIRIFLFLAAGGGMIYGGLSGAGKDDSQPGLRVPNKK